MATSTVLRRWYLGGTSSICILYSSQIIVFMFSEILLSRTCSYFGIILARFSWSIMDWHARIIPASLRIFIGLTMIALLLILTNTMMYLLPRCECLGNWPV